MKNIQSIEEFVNESNETTVDKVLTPKEKKALKSAMESVYLGIDKLSFKRDGSIVAKRGYYYRHSQSPESTANDLIKGLKKVGIEITIIDKYDDFNPWPKDSNFVVVFKIKEIK